MPEQRMTIAALRVRAGYTQDEAAKFLGVSKATLGKWEADSSQITYAKMLAIADLYRWAVDDIYFGDSVEFSDEIRKEGGET